MTGSFPSEERYGIVSQLRRAAVSVPTNIAQGSKRRSKAQLAHLLNVAEGSLAEIEYLVQLSGDLAYLTHDVVGTLLAEIDEVARMLYTLRSKVEREER